jgi:hypothetical protein
MAAITLIHMPAKLCGSANLDGAHGTELVYGKFTGLSVCGAVLPEDIGHFHVTHGRY